MARDFVEELIFREMERSVGTSTEADQYLVNNANGSSGESDIFGVIKQSLRNYKSVFDLFPFRRKGSKSDEQSPEPKKEQIEMSQFEEQQIGCEYEGTLLRAPVKGHDFRAHQLSNPTWCDECGDFIWGVYKQCLKCYNCQFTCHHQCLSQIRLDCKFVTHEPPGPDEDEGAVLLGETSLSDLNDPSQSTELLSEPASEKDETDSGYRSGTIPDEKLPHKPSDATLNREELQRRIAEYNKSIPGANFALREDESNNEAFQGFLKVTLNLVRPISMSLGARPPSIYEVLTREHIIEQNTQNISFYMPRDTVRCIHAQSHQTTKEVIALLLKKFHILDHPRKFALYEQELKNNKIAKLRRVKDAECLLSVCLNWELDNLSNHRLVLQENETGEIDWDAFCVPELDNFMRVLDREENEYLGQLQYKYKVMKRIILQRMKEIRVAKEKQKRQSMLAGESKS